MKKTKRQTVSVTGLTDVSRIVSGDVRQDLGTPEYQSNQSRQTITIFHYLQPLDRLCHLSTVAAVTEMDFDR